MDENRFPYLRVISPRRRSTRHCGKWGVYTDCCTNCYTCRSLPTPVHVGGSLSMACCLIIHTLWATPGPNWPWKMCRRNANLLWRLVLLTCLSHSLLDSVVYCNCVVCVIRSAVERTRSIDYSGRRTRMSLAPTTSWRISSSSTATSRPSLPTAVAYFT